METNTLTRTTTLSQPVVTALNAAAEATRMTAEESESFVTHPVARLIAALPFAAGCEDAARTSLAHLSIYVLAQRGAARRVFDHSPVDNDDVMTRLRLITTFKGGDQSIIDAGMARLGLVAVIGHSRDLAKDAASGEYNPVLEAKWSVSDLGVALVDRARFGELPELDAVMDRRVTETAWWGI